jgi:hypothetical protein
MTPSSKRPLLALSLLVCAVVLASPGAARAAPAVVETFKSALQDGSPIRLLSVWPKKGSVKLFGQKFDYEKAGSRAKYDDGVFELMHWPKAGEKGAAAESSETKQGRVMLYTVKPVGAEGPVCFLRSPKPGVDPILVECREK